MIKDYLNYALQSLRHRRLRSWLTMIGIFIGIASVISLIGLGEGLRIAITSQFGFLGTDVLSVQASGLNYAGPPGSGVINPLKDDLVPKIKNVNGVDTAFGRIIESGKMEFNGKQDIVFIISMPPGEDRKTVETILNLKTSEGRLLKDGDVKLLLGNDFTKDIEFEKGIHVGDRVILNDKGYEVVGIIEKKGSFIYDTAVYVNEDVVRDIFGDDGFYDVIAIKVKDTKNIDSVKEAIEKLLRKERDVKKGEEDFSVESPQKTLEALSSTLFAVNLFVYIIATISLVVGGIGIMNTMYTAVLERTKEIGIMKSIGARNSAIFTLFFIESGFLGLVGGILGILFGAGLAYTLAFFGRLALGSDLIRVSISLFLVIGALAFSFILGTLFGVLPAIRASKLRPVDALRSK